jgi:sulfite reductase (NADPH) flavoprotein alpha-component
MTAEHKQVFRGRHLTNRLLTGEGSGKITRHHEISLEAAPVHYLPGDALGLYPINDPALIDRILTATHATGDEPITTATGESCTFRESLAHLNLTTPTRKLMELFASRGVSEFAALLDKANADHLRDYISAKNASHDVLDVLELHPHVSITADELAGALRRNLPRLYSVASSQQAHPGQVHALVVSVRYHVRGRERLGVCSTWIADRWPVGDTAEMYLQNQQKHFAMPADPSTPIIMVGPGTGLAPFRAFIQERRVTGAPGRNWLFFGEQRRATDFFYEAELTGYERDGFLRLDLAFSRDQPHKVYVQHRMIEQARDIWAWLEEGAEFFVCGDKERMAADVDHALHEIVQTAGGKTPDQAHEYIEALKAAKRYKRDVY